MGGEVSDTARTLERAEAALRKCERLVIANRYAGAIMHEVNNPLAAITNLVYLTMLQADDPYAVRENLALVDEQLRSLAKVTGQVLAFQRDQASPRKFDLIDLIESALKLHRHKVSSGKVVVKKHFRIPATAHVLGNEILQVVSNLLLNAFDALPEIGGEMCIRVKTVGESVHITIADNGSGMSPETMKGLYEAYRTTKKDGTGLGLWLSKSIVDKHRGHLRVKSSQNPKHKGTTFRLSLPVKTSSWRPSH